MSNVLKTRTEDSLASANFRHQILCYIGNSLENVRRNEIIAKLCQQGLNRAQIAGYLGLTRQRISQLTTQLGIETLPRKSTKNCENCQKPFTKFNTVLSGRKRFFCSPECRRAKMAQERPTIPCSACGKTFARTPRNKRFKRAFCSPECYYSVRRTIKYKPWRQGQRRARAIVSKYFDLRPEYVVHHEDKDNANNDLINLRVFASQADHMAYHHGVTKVVPIWDGRMVKP